MNVNSSVQFSCYMKISTETTHILHVDCRKVTFSARAHIFMLLFQLGRRREISISNLKHIQIILFLRFKILFLKMEVILFLKLKLINVVHSILVTHCVLHLTFISKNDATKLYLIVQTCKFYITF